MTETGPGLGRPPSQPTQVNGADLRSGPLQRLRWWYQDLEVSRGEREEAQADDAIRRCSDSLTRPNVVAVLGAKGGSGKTTTAMIVGDVLAERLRLRAIVVDLTTKPGTLRFLAPPDRRSERSVVDVIRCREDTDCATQLRPYVGILPSGLHLLGGPADPEPLQALTEAERDGLFDLLHTFYELIIIDIGDERAAPQMKETLARADQLVVVSTPERLTGELTEQLLGYLDVDEPAVAVAVNQCRVRGERDLLAVERALRRRDVRAEVVIPYDLQLRRMLNEGGYSLHGLSERPSRVAWKLLAARVAEALQ